MNSQKTSNFMKGETEELLVRNPILFDDNFPMYLRTCQSSREASITLEAYSLPDIRFNLMSFLFRKKKCSGLFLTCLVILSSRIECDFIVTLHQSQMVLLSISEHFPPCPPQFLKILRLYENFMVCSTVGIKFLLMFSFGFLYAGHKP